MRRAVVLRCTEEKVVDVIYDVLEKWFYDAIVEGGECGERAYDCADVGAPTDARRATEEIIEALREEGCL